ncbi:MAG TPA: LamG domain-containing protein [Candidatus Pacearchaeota archaeon]|nr:LamG domain-containing protein [Candidatus Pacearchaeota archaeon]HQM24357.1 LamG domain-containing protein [Candidatus Pacearchaeota archaeon]
MNKSFTLIEILVVIIVIGILSAFILVGMSSITSNANTTKIKVFINSIDNSLLTSRVSYWSLNGNANDSWGTNNGTLVGPTHLPVLKTGSDCIIESCYEFDGSEDYISCGNGLNNIYNEDVFSLTMWVYKQSTGTVKALFTNRDVATVGNIFIFKSATEYLVCDLYDASSIRWTTTYQLPSNIWTSVVFVHNGTNTILYINGVQKDSTSSQSTASFPGTSTYGTFIGRDSQSAQYFWQGKIDDVRIYNQAISTSTIEQNYFLGLSNLCKNEILSKTEYVQKINQFRNHLVNNE